MISDKKAVQDVVELLAKKGIRHVIITPGSRNAPFSISFHDNSHFEVVSIVDERSAAYVALGIAQQSDRPVALVCTSGTAALNYAPAIAEAFYQEIPLIVITADRPMEWVNQGEGQTIDQTGIFSNYCRASYTIVQDMNDKDFEWYNARIMNEAFDRAMWPVRGPVHLNFPLRENLYRTVDKKAGPVKTIERTQPVIALSGSQIRELSDEISHKSRVMVLVGQFHSDPEMLSLLSQWAEKENVLVFTESHSGLESSSFIGCIDRMIMTMSEQELNDLRPELVISIGKNIISKKIKAFLRNEAVEHWYVSEDALVMDTFQRLTRIIPVKPGLFFDSLLHEWKGKSSGYRIKFLSLHEEKRKAGEMYVAGCEYSDLLAMRMIMDALPERSFVQMGNSSVARYIQLFDRNETLHFSGNRGVSGIDGCTSTAVGASYVTEGITTLISGDVAFLYDSNAFWNRLVTSRLKVVVINNGGGGIFRIIEGPSQTEALEEFFETAHERSVKPVCEMYGLAYYSADSKSSLKKALAELYQSNVCSVLEVFTPRLENDRVLKGFFRYIKEKTSQA